MSTTPPVTADSNAFSAPFVNAALVRSRYGRPPVVQIGLSGEMSVEERARFVALAATFQARATYSPEGLLMTPGRAQKCVALFKAGYSAHSSACFHFYCAPGSSVRVAASKAVADIRRNEKQQVAA